MLYLKMNVSSSNKRYYYEMDHNAKKIFILEDEWKLVFFKKFYYSTYMISIGNSLYLTGNYNVWK